MKFANRHSLDDLLNLSNPHRLSELARTILEGDQVVERFSIAQHLRWRADAR